MAFKPLADLDCTTTTAIGGTNKETGAKNPISIEGYYIGTRQVPSKKSKTGLAALHILQTASGNVGVWGKTNLDQKMPSVLPGQLIRVSFVGMVETPNNPMYKYKVEVDADNTIQVASSEGVADSTERYDTSNNEDTLVDDYATEEPSPQPVRRPSSPAQPASAAQQSAVRSVLGAKR